ncbi:hypothetical protein Syun_014662 [Stephania yunnanensis]|uniref:Uncharacterized protein n=1 Tax=Stephania yunnanensis TaxID=152371 RepID=A0AAP0JM35_9MAGN
MPPVSATATAASSQSASSVESLADVGIFTATGEFVLFKDMWDQNEGVAVVALLRHFGCICCWELASALKEVKPKLDASGVKLIAVGVGPPEKARMLSERWSFHLSAYGFFPLLIFLLELAKPPERKLAFADSCLCQELMLHLDAVLPFPMDCLYADPDRKTNVFSRFSSLKKVWKNYTITATPDDRSSVLQLGGMFVFKGNKLLYSRKDEGTGDHAPLDEVINICCSATSNA